MVFTSICIALYDYIPQSEMELAIQEGELIYVLEKSAEDNWWKAKKRASSGEEEEPVGLIPNNYVEEAQPTHHARALYDYVRQTDEELSFSEDAVLDVYDTTDPDWTLVGLSGEYGFAPANYIEINEAVTPGSPSSSRTPRASKIEADHQSLEQKDSHVSSPQTPAAALAGIIHLQATGNSSATQVNTRRTPSLSLPPQPVQYTPDASDEESPTPPPPSLPQRPPSQQLSRPPTQYESPRSPISPGVVESPPYNRASPRMGNDGNPHPSPGGFHLYNVNEMVSAMGKKKKIPTTLGLDRATGNIMLAPAKSRDGEQQEWTAEKLTHYSIEGKHVFVELVRPSKSLDLHAGAKDTAHEIVAALGEIAGAVRAEGLREVIAAGSGSAGQKKGHVLYEFLAQGDDEVTVAIGDEVVVLDDTKSEEWWMIRRLKNGETGVVPSSYIEVTGSSVPPSSVTGLNAGRSTVEQNRLEEERLARDSAKALMKVQAEKKAAEVGPGMKLPNRASSLTVEKDNNRGSLQRSKRESRSDARPVSTSKPKPDASKCRTWTDRSGSFKVEAEFIGLKDGKIHLHKLNGVKIAVSVVKMAVEDLEFVERVTGVSLDEDKPLSDIRRRSTQKVKEQMAKEAERKKPPSTAPSSAPKSGASVQQPKQPEYDWFDFFLKCGVSPYQCERYASNFNKDSMDEAILPDITASVLRTLGLKEGDILRVMKFLGNKYGRTGTQTQSKLRNVSFGDEEATREDGEGPTLSPNGTGGGLFSGPGGALRNNTRKGRPAPTVQNSDVVSAGAFKQRGTDDETQDRPEPISIPLTLAPPPEKKPLVGFDDDAWEVKPSKQQTSISQLPAITPTAPAPSQPALTGSLAELSLLSPPLQPTITHSTGALQQQLQPPPAPLAQQIPQPRVQQPVTQQPTGANPSFFSQLGPQSTGPQPQQLNNLQQNYSPVNQQQQPQQNMPQRQRPQAPPSAQSGSLMLPPPPRPFSAPQNASLPNGFGPPPLQPQMTGGMQNFQSLAPPGQSLNDLNQQRLQHQFSPQQTGFGQQPYNPYSSGLIPQQTGFIPQPQQQQQQLQSQQTGYLPSPGFQQSPGFQPSPSFFSTQQTGSPFADPRPAQPYQPLPPQQTGFQSLQPQQTGINAFLPPALQPQQTGISNGFQRPGFGQPPPPIPPMPPMPTQQPTMAPLQPQKTGPAPTVSFGGAPKLAPQPTGRKANLSQATPENPFGLSRSTLLN